MVDPVGSAPVTFTIGYSGKSIADFVEALNAVRVNRVVDVRELPLSRKKGFSKTALGDALSRVGIEYLHLRVAGNPYRAQKDDVAACLALYSAHVDRHPEVLQALEDAVDGNRAALLCFESDACDCHRSVLAARMAARNPRRRIKHL
jgi:uncharacterized protein (DUF488 family)